MPYKDYQTHLQKARQRYIDHPERWKNPDGTWKRRPYSEIKETRKRHYHKNKERIRAYYRRKTKEREQIGTCPICQCGPLKLVYDHDHRTGLFRDWICSKCNVMLGMAHDKAEVLNAGATYLRNFQEGRGQKI